MIFKKEILKHLSQELLLPFTGIEQDWDIEMADSNRIKDFIKFYEDKELSLDEKVALVALIIASYNDFLEENNLQIDRIWNSIKRILEFEKDNFTELINYWALDNEKEENIFKITPLIRSLKFQ